jgi:hypothetical protein
VSRYDRRDPTPAEMKLTKAIHYLFEINRKLPLTVAEYQGIGEALEILFEAKRQVKKDVQKKSAESFRKWQGAA